MNRQIVLPKKKAANSSRQATPTQEKQPTAIGDEFPSGISFPTTIGW
jgi:hypothetical protein